MKWNMFLLILLISMSGQAQNQSYNLGANINSEYDEINPVTSPDGKTLYFTRVNHPNNGYGVNSQDIWWAKAESDSTWFPATRLSALNIAQYNAVVDVSDDGNTLLINGVFNKKGNFWKKRGLSISKKSDESWSAPVSIRANAYGRKNRGRFSGGDMSPDGQAIVVSYGKVHNGKKSKIFILTKKSNGKWTAPKNIKELNSHGTNEAPSFSEDGSTIYFSSNRDGDFAIYSTEKVEGDKNQWSKPKLLETSANSSGWDSFFRISQDERWAYFASSSNSMGKADIFRVIPPSNKNYIIIKGRILDADLKQVIIGKEFSILTNETAPDSLVVNPVDGTFLLKLPRGEKLTLKSSAEDYIPSERQLFTVTDVSDFDFELTKIPNVKIKGRLLIKGDDVALPSSAKPVVKINGEVVDSLRIDLDEAEYEVFLKPGQQYSMSLEAEGYQSLAPAELDLSGESPDLLQQVDLYVDRSGMVTVTGLIKDKSSGEPINSEDVSIEVEELKDMNVNVDPQTGRYEVKLPPDNEYNLLVKAPKYFPTSETLKGGEGETINKDILLSHVGVGESVQLNNILFVRGKADLVSSSNAELEHLVSFLNEYPDVKILIGGHTDSRGSKTLNQQLSEDRANAVRDYLVGRGIKRSRLTAKGFGMEKPVASNETEEGRTLNRRVEITILKI